MTFLGALTLIFITLKLTGVIAWSWFFVLIPLFVPILLLIFAGIVWIIGMTVAAILTAMAKKRSSKARRLTSK